MTTNPYSKLLNAYPHSCCTLGTISSSKLDYATPSFCISKEIVLPCHNWSMQTGCQHLYQAATNVSLRTILLEVGGPIHSR